MGASLLRNHPAYDMALLFRDRFGEEEFFLFPLGWGAAREADAIDRVRETSGLRYIRYDLPVNSYAAQQFSNGVYYRGVEVGGQTVYRRMKRGEAIINSREGPKKISIPPVDFSGTRSAVFLDDWIKYSGLGLLGGIAWGVKYSDMLKLGQIHPAVFRKERDLELPPELKQYDAMVGDLLAPHPSLVTEIIHKAQQMSELMARPEPDKKAS